MASESREMSFHGRHQQKKNSFITAKSFSPGELRHQSNLEFAVHYPLKELARILSAFRAPSAGWHISGHCRNFARDKLRSGSISQAADKRLIPAAPFFQYKPGRCRDVHMKLKIPPTAAAPTRASNCLENVEWPKQWPYSESDLTPEDSSRDEFFYILPKLGHHAAEDARARLTEYYDFVLPPQGTGSVLDLCSSWTSHYPPDWRGKRMVAIGLNPLELALNPSKTEFKVQNLNLETRLPFGDGEFDVITNSLSVDYLTKPLDVFREMRRVLKVGGVASCAFTNRCFPTKVIPIWMRPFDDLRHIRIVANYFHFSGFDDISVVDMSPAGWDGVNNPMYVIQATKRAE